MGESNCEICIQFRNDVNKIKDIDTDKNCIVNGYGTYDSEIIFIGEGPGKWGAALTCIPFTKDSSGKIVQKALSELKISHNCFITNLFRCYSYKIIEKTMEHKQRLEDYKKHCMLHLKNEIKNLNNLKLVCIIGKNVYGKYIDKEYLEELKNRYNVFYIYHPSYYRNRKHLSEDECVSKFIEEYKSKNKEIKIIV